MPLEPSHDAVVFPQREGLVMAFHPKDRLILALASQLRAERETREALAFVIENGAIDREVLLAILEDPVPPVSIDDLNFANELTERMASSSQIEGTSERLS
jgi:hypothetical protein